MVTRLASPMCSVISAGLVVSFLLGDSHGDFKQFPLYFLREKKDRGNWSRCFLWHGWLLCCLVLVVVLHEPKTLLRVFQRA